MELKIDLLKEKRKKSLFGVILGILFFLVACSWIIVRIIKIEIITLFDWFYFGIMLLNGILQFTGGLGYSFGNLFGKAYILINSEVISIKAGVFDKNQFVNWSEIEFINYNLNKFEIKKTDNTNMVINLSMFDYRLINEIKKTINGIAKEKKIQSTININT
jgi:hypothetical protein